MSENYKMLLRYDDHYCEGCRQRVAWYFSCYMDIVNRGEKRGAKDEVDDDDDAIEEGEHHKPFQ